MGFQRLRLEPFCLDQRLGLGVGGGGGTGWVLSLQVWLAVLLPAKEYIKRLTVKCVQVHFAQGLISERFCF